MQELPMSIPEEQSSQDRHKGTCCCWSGAYKILRQKPPKSLHKSFHKSVRHGSCKIFMQWPLREDLTRISTRSSLKALYRTMQSIFKILMQGLLGRLWTGSPQKLLRRTREDFARSPRSCARSCKDLLGRTSPGSPGTTVWCEPAQSKGTWTYGHVRRAILCASW